jgi:hypothetical protein
MFSLCCHPIRLHTLCKQSKPGHVSRKKHTGGQ